MPTAPVITRLSLTDFRNYATLGLDLSSHAIVLTGENGSGKTNLLEAVSFLSPGRGLRRAELAEVTRGGSSAFGINAHVQSGDDAWTIGTGTIGIAAGEPLTRKVRINGASARSADAFLDILRVVWLTPAMDALFTGPAADRRRFLDRLVLAIDTQHGQRALDFEKAMRNRNRMLSDGVTDRRWFEATEQQMVEAGVAISAARSELVRLLAAMVERLPADGPFPQSVIALDGTLETMLTSEPAVEVEEYYRRSLSDGRERDRAAGRTLEGPHRADLLVRHRPKDMPAEYCSTGEQKALLVGMIVSHARLSSEMSGMVPVLLLDEIAAHFDPGRRAALFAILQDLGGQCFMTGTERALFSALEGQAQFLDVSSGTIRSA